MPLWKRAKPGLPGDGHELYFNHHGPLDSVLVPPVGLSIQLGGRRCALFPKISELMIIRIDFPLTPRSHVGHNTRSMRDMTDEFKLSVRSIAEVFQALGGMVTRLAVTRRVRFRGKKPTRAAVVNAALLYLDSLPPEQWEQALSIGMRRLEQILASDPTEEVKPAPTEEASAPPKRVTLDVEDVTTPASGKPVRRIKRS